jgi:hypothetical protein
LPIEEAPKQLLKEAVSEQSKIDVRRRVSKIDNGLKL